MYRGSHKGGLTLTCLDVASLCRLSWGPETVPGGEWLQQPCTHTLRYVFFSVTFIFKEGFHTMLILVSMASSTVSHPLYLPSERIPQPSQSGPDVYCLISSFYIQRQLHTSDTEVCRLSLRGGSSSHGRYITFLHLSAAELLFLSVNIYIWLAVVCLRLEIFSQSFRSNAWLHAITAGFEPLSLCSWTALFLQSTWEHLNLDLFSFHTTSIPFPCSNFFFLF